MRIPFFLSAQPFPTSLTPLETLPKSQEFGKKKKRNPPSPLKPLPHQIGRRLPMEATEVTELSLPFELQGRNPVDWSDLLPDLLQTISKRLHDISDFIYFRAVCKKWRAATSISHLPHQIPWLLEDRNNVKNSEHLRFYSLFSGKILSIHCPPARGKYLYGPSHGYLHAANLDSDNPTHSLLNPLTEDEVIINFGRYYPTFLVCMGPDPMGSEDHMAFSLSDDCSETIGFYQPRNWEWDYVELPLVSNSGHACFKGMYYMNEAETGNTLVVNISCGSSISVPPPETLVSSGRVYFVESAGKILRVVKQLNLGLAVSNSDFSFDIYQLDVGDENHEYRWVKTSSIGNQILFLDWRNGISVTARETTEFMGNCIYYLQSRSNGPVQLSCDVFKYYIEDGRTEKVPSPFKKGDTWFVPRAVGSVSAGPY